MPHLLHIDSSVLGEQSVSRRLTARAAERWRAARPGGTVTYRDLATDPIPHLDAETGAARHLPAELRTPAHQASFALSAELIDEIKRADTVLLGLPLYNYGPPSPTPWRRLDCSRKSSPPNSPPPQSIPRWPS
jgi:FMN-dependent NADH-azoreductase